MIKKFIEIKNVGKFINYCAQGDVTLDKVNIIYGENSTGKTTLSSIIRSLSKNKPDLVLERKSFGSSDEQYIELLLENNKQFTFQGSNWDTWDDGLKNIEIFDEIFINENIYTGLEIQSEHQKCLYQFAIGEEGVNLAKEIEAIKQESKSKQQELKSLEEKMKLITKEYFGVDDYIDLSEDKEIDNKIEKKKQELKIAEAGDEIKGKGLFKEIQKFSLPFDFSHLKGLLDKSLTTISEEALQKTKDHISKLDNLLQNKAESWLHQGLLCVEDIKDNKCPFCQQDLKNTEDTIKSYQQYFNLEYRELKKSVENYSRQIESVNIESLLNNLKNTVSDNNTLYEFWKRFLENIKVPEIKVFEKYYKQISKEFSQLKYAIASKLRSILTPIETSCLDKLLESISEFNEIIETYNASIRNFNEQIREVKNKQPDIDRLRNDIAKLEIEKQRYSLEINKLCEKYKNIKKEIDEFKNQIEQKKEELRKAISQKVEKYSEETNKILGKFCTPFKIVKQTQRYRGRGEEPYFEYFLEIERCEINPLHRAKFTLSGGDRNALAIAFFLAKIFIDGNIDNKIIIFDDPISSFDINRKRRTIEFTRDLSKNAKQVIVLTHLSTFAFELYDSLRDIGIKPKCLQIINIQISEWDINEDKKLPYFKNLSKLEDFVNNEQKLDINETRRLIRICLEDKLKFNYFQFFSDLGDDCWLGTIAEKLRTLKDDSKLKFKNSDKDEVIREIGNLCDFSSPSHHSNIKTLYKTDYTQTEIVNYVKSALRLIYEEL